MWMPRRKRCNLPLCMTNGTIIAAISSVNVFYVLLCGTVYQVGEYKIPIEKSPDQIMTEKWHLLRGVFGRHCGWPPGTESPGRSPWQKHRCNHPSCHGPMEEALSGHNRVHVPSTMTDVQRCWMSSDLYPRWARHKRTKRKIILYHIFGFDLGKNSGWMKLLT